MAILTVRLLHFIWCGYIQKKLRRAMSGGRAVPHTTPMGRTYSARLLATRLL